MEAVDPSVKDVLYNGEYSFRVTPEDENAFVLVKSNGIRVKGSGNLYKITDIQENQTVTVEYTSGVEAGEDGSYEIANEAELISVLEKNPENLVLKLGADITLGGASMSMTQEDAFSGVFDGQGHRVSGLPEKFPNAPTAGWGTDTSAALGGLVGNNFGTIEKNAFYGEIKAEREWPGDSSGGIAAQSDGIVRYCYNTGSVANYIAGGIVGRTNNYYGDEMPLGVVEHCYNAGTINAGGGTVGGAVVGFTNWYSYSSHSDREAFWNALKDNYFLAGTYTGDAGFDGQAGNWLYVVNGKFGGSVYTSGEIKGDAEVTFIRLDENSPVDKAASFGQTVYEGIRTVDMEVTLQAASLSGNTLAPLAGASITAQKGWGIRKRPVSSHR